MGAPFLLGEAHSAVKLSLRVQVSRRCCCEIAVSRAIVRDRFCAARDWDGRVPSTHGVVSKLLSPLRGSGIFHTYPRRLHAGLTPKSPLRGSRCHNSQFLFHHARCDHSFVTASHVPGYDCGARLRRDRAPFMASSPRADAHGSNKFRPAGWVHGGVPPCRQRTAIRVGHPAVVSCRLSVEGQRQFTTETRRHREGGAYKPKQPRISRRTRIEQRVT